MQRANSVDEKLVRIYRIKLKIENGMSSSQTVEYALIMSQLGNIQDLKFVDDEKLMLVMSQECKQSALREVTRLVYFY